MLCEQDTPVSDGCEMLGGYRQCNGTVAHGTGWSVKWMTN